MLEQYYIEPDFNSLFNSYVGKDKLSTRIYSAYHSGKWRIDGHVMTTSNNLNKQRWATNSTEQLKLNLRYHATQPHAITRWLGTPTYSAHYIHTDYEIISLNNNYYNQYQRDDISFTNQFQYPKWHWRWQWGHKTNNNKSDPQRTQHWQLKTHFPLGFNTTIETSWQLKNTRYLSKNKESLNKKYTFKLHHLLLNPLKGHLTFSFNQRKSVNIDNYQHSSTSFTTDWHHALHTARRHFPDIAIKLSNKYQYIQDSLNQITRADHQTTLNFIFSWDAPTKPSYSNEI